MTPSLREELRTSISVSCPQMSTAARDRPSGANTRSRQSSGTPVGSPAMRMTHSFRHVPSTTSHSNTRPSCPALATTAPLRGCSRMTTTEAEWRNRLRWTACVALRHTISLWSLVLLPWLPTEATMNASSQVHVMQLSGKLESDWLRGTEVQAVGEMLHTKALPSEDDLW